MVVRNRSGNFAYRESQLKHKIYDMKRRITDTRILTAVLLASGMSVSASGAVPEAPSNLAAEVQGTIVNLSWDSAAMGMETSDNGFETAFPGQGWSVRTTNTNDPCFTWFQYPTDNYTSAENWRSFIHEGDHSAFVQFDLNISNPGDKTLTQDEWLISPKLPGTSYISFWFLINSMLLDYGTDPAFPNDYYVKVSRDDGETWTDVWNARYDMKKDNGYQQAVVCLGEPCDDMRVAFVAVSDPDVPNAGLYFSWALDDVRTYAAEPDAALVRGYNVYRGDELIAANVHYNSFRDEDPKEFGDYTYNVTAVGADGESDAASVQVTLVQPDYNPPLDFTLTSGYDEETGTYTIHGAWKAPEGDFRPSYYEVYNDGASCAWVGPDDPLEFEQTYIPAGTYSYEVFAVYENPWGESEHVLRWVTVGGRSTVTGISGRGEGHDVILEWGAPTAPDIDDLKAYVIRRGREIVADDVKELSYTDLDVPDGLYRYSVSCLYKDGSESAPKTVSVLANRIPPRGIPHVEDFNAGELPQNWDVGTFDNMTADDYIFRFDDPTGLGFSGDGFDGAFVSADSDNAGMMFISTYLTSPVYDLTAVQDRSGLTLEFSYDYPSGMSSAAALEFSNDEGATWTPWDGLSGMLESYDPDGLGIEGTPFRPQLFSENASAACTAETIMFRIRYEAQYDWHFALDNWKFYDANNSGVADVASDNLKLSVNGRTLGIGSAEQVRTLAAYDMSGRLVAEATGNAKTTTLTLPAAGIYTVKAVTATSTRVWKIAVR